MEKRDRYIELLLHRATGTLILKPGVCYMIGVGTAFGDPVVYEGGAKKGSKELGLHLIQLLDDCKEADIDAMAAQRTAALHRKWRGESVAAPDFAHAASSGWQAITAQFPILLKGPAAILRVFAWAQLVDRDSWKSRKLTQHVRSEYPGALADCEATRLRKSGSAEMLGEAVLDFMHNC